jgi:hypothetical protein
MSPPRRSREWLTADFSGRAAAAASGKRHAGGHDTIENRHGLGAGMVTLATGTPRVCAATQRIVGFRFLSMPFTLIKCYCSEVERAPILDGPLLQKLWKCYI